MNKQWKSERHPDWPPGLVTIPWWPLTCSGILGSLGTPRFENWTDLLCSKELPKYQLPFRPKHKVVLPPSPFQCHFGAAFQAVGSKRSAGNWGWGVEGTFSTWQRSGPWGDTPSIIGVSFRQ